MARGHGRSSAGGSMTRYFQDDYTPWSFVLPIALAVMVGVLAADLVRLTVVGLLANAATEELQTDLQQTTPDQLPAPPHVVEAPEPPVRYQPRAGAPRLPGWPEGNRHGLDRACVGGTVLLRVLH